MPEPRPAQPDQRLPRSEGPDPVHGDEASDWNRALDKRIAEAATSTSFADRRLQEGQSVIVMGEDSQIIRRHPDGTTDTP